MAFDIVYAIAIALGGLSDRWSTASTISKVISKIPRGSSSPSEDFTLLHVFATGEFRQQGLPVQGDLFTIIEHGYDTRTPMSGKSTVVDSCITLIRKLHEHISALFSVSAADLYSTLLPAVKHLEGRVLIATLAPHHAQLIKVIDEVILNELHKFFDLEKTYEANTIARIYIALLESPQCAESLKTHLLHLLTAPSLNLMARMPSAAAAGAGFFDATKEATSDVAKLCALLRRTLDTRTEAAAAAAGAGFSAPKI